MDDLQPFRDEWEQTIARLIARAWIDPDFRRALLDDPHPLLHAEGLRFPQHYRVEFYDDPAARPGDWHSIGRAGGAIHRFPIPPAPSADMEAESLGTIDGSAACCSPCASCTGAVSHDTWY